MIPPVRHAVLLLIAGIGACGSGGPPPIPDAGGRQVAAISLLRWPKAGGKPPILYRFPTLERALWEARDTIPALNRIVGADLDQRQAFALSTRDGVVAIDLESGRNRPFLARVAIAEAGPDGTIYAVTRDTTLTSVSGRLPTAYPGKLPAIPISLVGTGSDQVYALVTGDSSLVISRQGQAQKRVSFPTAGLVHSRWGDVLAAADGDGVVLYEIGVSQARHTIDLGGKAAGLAFSPSGHRLYAVVEGDDIIQRFDRYTWRRLGTFDLPDPAGELRSDPLGRFLLAKPQQGDSVWVVDVVTGEFQGSWNTTWREDLPTVAGGRWLLVREGADVVAYDLFDADFKVAGRVAGGAGDLWQVLDWSPHAEGATTLDPDSTATVESAARATVYVQLSSSQNPAWAEELSNKLKSQGLPASVFRPKREDEFYRVVLGPYPSRESADSVGTRLGQPYFLYLPEDR